MKLKPIFVDESTQEGLHSVCLSKGSRESEFDLLMNRLTNPTYIRGYCKENLDYLTSGFYGNITLEEAIKDITSEVWEMTDKLYKASNKRYQSQGITLESIFKPLHNNEYKAKDLQETKFKLRDNKFPKAKVRIYAIRICQQIFVVTGGAIKVTHEMQGHKDTREEFVKIQRVRNWLKSENIITDEDLIYYYEQQE